MLNKSGKKLRILQVTSYYPPAMSFGGPPRVMFDFGQELLRRGHEVYVYTTDALDIEDWSAREEKEQEEMGGIKVRRFRRKKYSDKLPTKFLKLMVNGVDNQLARDISGFDIVHIAEVTSPLAVKCSTAAYQHKVPYVVSIFGNLSTVNSLPMKILRTKFDFLWGRKMLRNAAALLVQTPHERDMCARYNAPDRIVDMMLPIDLSLYQTAERTGDFRRRADIKENDKIVLFLGRIHKYKGISQLVAAFARLTANDGSGYRLVIAGADDGYKPLVLNEVQQLGIADKVLFTGPIFGREKIAAYSDADVFVTTPEIYEETSLAALEACACRTPVIVTDRNAIPGLEEYRAGRQLNSARTELLDALRQLLANGTREKMGGNARRLIEEKYRLEKVVDKLEALFQDIAQKRVS